MQDKEKVNDRIPSDEPASMSCGGYYWRLILKDVGDISRLKEAVLYICKEIDVHKAEAVQHGFEPSKMVCRFDLAACVAGNDIEQIRAVYLALIVELEEWREEFRKRDIWPPRFFEPSDVARRVLRD